MSSHKIKTDINHPFVRLVKQYCDDKLLDNPANLSALRKRFPAPLSHWAGLKGEVNLTDSLKKNALILVDRIITGKHVPTDDEIEYLAIRFNLLKQTQEEFLGLGRYYSMECASKQSADVTAKAEKPEFPEDEFVFTAIKAILKTRKFGVAGGVAVPTDPGYDRLPDAFTGTKLEIALKRYPELPQRIEFLTREHIEKAINPEPYLLSSRELDQIRTGLRLNDSENRRLLQADNNMRASIENLKNSRNQDRYIHRILEAYRSEETPYDGKDKATLALSDLLRIRGKEDKTNISKSMSDEEKRDIVQEIIDKYDLARFECMGSLVATLMKELNSVPHVSLPRLASKHFVQFRHDAMSRDTGGRARGA